MGVGWRRRSFLNNFFEKCDYEQIAAFCRSVLETKGTVFFSGVGKSGFIGQKISMTLVSTGTKSVFLSPTDALHGDIGILTPDDLLVLLSKSGSTEELLKLIPYARVHTPPHAIPSPVPGLKAEPLALETASKTGRDNSLLAYP